MKGSTGSFSDREWPPYMLGLVIPAAGGGGGKKQRADAKKQNGQTAFMLKVLPSGAKKQRW